MSGRPRSGDEPDEVLDVVSTGATAGDDLRGDVMQWGVSQPMSVAGHRHVHDGGERPQARLGVGTWVERGDPGEVATQNTFPVVQVGKSRVSGQLERPPPHLPL